MIALRLDPTIPMMTPKGKGRAFIMLDYSEDQHLYFVVALNDTGQIWTFKNPEVRVLDNDTLGTKTEKIPLT